MLIIDADEWETALLEKSLRDAGFDVSVARAAREGLTRAKALLPDCIVCDVELPDIDGYWVAQRVRKERSRVATTPFLFLTRAEDQSGRLMGLSVGADIFMTKPVIQEEIVAQVSALLGMAARLRSQQATLADTSPPSRRAAALRGDLAQMSLGTVLTMLELERRSGLLKLESTDSTSIAIEVADGTLVSAKANGELRDPILLLREILNLNRGTFWFRTLVVPVKGKLRIGMALLEASRQEDEANH